MPTHCARRTTAHERTQRDLKVDLKVADLNVVAALCHRQVARKRSLKSLHYFCNYKAISGVADD